MLLSRTCPGCRTRSSGLCGPCLRRCERADPLAVGHGADGLSELDQVLALFHYDRRLQRVILAAKNGGRRDVIAQLGCRLAAAGLADQPGIGSSAETRLGFDVVTWVPASSHGVRRRGYDQGRLLAGAVASRLDLPTRRLLLRPRGHAQAGRNRRDRLTGPPLLAPLGAPGRVLVVDDVITTGASMSAAATALRAGGARFVAGWAIARSLDRSRCRS